MVTALKESCKHWQQYLTAASKAAASLQKKQESSEFGALALSTTSAAEIRVSDFRTLRPKRRRARRRVRQCSSIERLKDQRYHAVAGQDGRWNA